MTDTNKKNHFTFLSARAELHFLTQFLLSQKPPHLHPLSTFSIQYRTNSRGNNLIASSQIPRRRYFTLQILFYSESLDLLRSYVKWILETLPQKKYLADSFYIETIQNGNSATNRDQKDCQIFD